MPALFSFPPGFLFGTATAATQVEGGSVDTDWARFAREPGRVHGGDTPEHACDHWHRFREDAALQRDLGMNAHRMSLEWARVEPRPGEFDGAALDHYRAMLGALVDAGITPMVTLHHFTLPGWAADAGGFLNPDLPDLLARYAAHAVEALGDLCRLWITLNEPNVAVAQGYLLGAWPPARRDPVAAARAHHHLLQSHVRMYRAIHALGGVVRGGPSVGVAHHLRVMVPERSARGLDRAGAGLLRAVFNDAFARALCDGVVAGAVDPFVSALGDFDVREAKGTQDFFGVNYYGRDLVRFDLRAHADMFLRRGVAPGAEVTDLGWEVYPEGLGLVLSEWSERCGRLPMYVTENGLADATDAQRPSFLVRHLAEVARAARRGVDVRGYMHWSLLDNFEWAEGYGPRFGLVAVDYATQARTPRRSAHLYASIARARAIDVDTWRAHGEPPLAARRA